jgi:carbamoyltransferase
MKILGIAAFYHDSSASLISDGKIISAYQEERFTRVKHDACFPKNSILQCLKDSDIRPDEIDAIVFYEKPFLKFERLLETYLAFTPRGFQSFCSAIPLWLNEKLFQKKLLIDNLVEIGFSKKQCTKILFSEHHLSHAASAFYPSPYEEAIILTMDGVGEWQTTGVYIGQANKIQKIKEINFPHSLGLLYSAFTYYCGFKVNSGEYKLMGLAPYGQPIYADVIRNKLIDIKEDGSFRLDMNYFDYCTGLTMTNEKFNILFQNKKRAPEDKLEQFHMDLAASIQLVTEEIMLKICNSLKEEFKIKNLCLAGGVALNCVANGKIYLEGIFENIWIQPASGDAGGSLGAALSCYYDHFNHERIINASDSMNGSFLGTIYTHLEIEESLVAAGAIYEILTDEKLYAAVTNALVNEEAVGWFQGRMEFGPRSLGNRSIIADPRSEKMQKKLNLKVKFRESFRPFAPAILEEDTSDYFEFKGRSPYMLMVAQVNEKMRIKMSSEEETLFGIDKLNIKRSSIPAVTHVDYSARLQTVSKQTNKRFHELISHFKARTGCPVLINTSFNIRGEPIVCSPLDAFKCFMGTDLDMLVIQNFILHKKSQNPALLSDYRSMFALD